MIQLSVDLLDHIAGEFGDTGQIPAEDFMRLMRVSKR
jgi:hypothetical protein